MREQTTLEIFYDYNNLPVDIGEFKWVSASNHNAEVERLRNIADKLAEALEKVNKWRPNEFQDRELYEHGQQALKEYRSGVATDQDEGPGGENE